jgi:hypothetical protein
MAKSVSPMAVYGCWEAPLRKAQGEYSGARANVGRAVNAANAQAKSLREIQERIERLERARFLSPEGRRTLAQLREAARAKEGLLRETRDSISVLREIAEAKDKVRETLNQRAQRMRDPEYRELCRELEVTLKAGSEKARNEAMLAQVMKAGQHRAPEVPTQVPVREADATPAHAARTPRSRVVSLQKPGRQLGEYAQQLARLGLPADVVDALGSRPRADTADPQAIARAQQGPQVVRGGRHAHALAQELARERLLREQNQGKPSP